LAFLFIHNRKLLERKHQFDYIIIETTGLADPSPIAQTFFIDTDIVNNIRLDGIITVRLPLLNADQEIIITDGTH
jgi:G3E family GTPase